MFVIKDILQHLQKLELNKNIARLSFYNYLNLFHKKEESFNFSIVEKFFLKSLYFSFWQENIVSLQDSLLLDLKIFSFNWPIKNLTEKELIYIKNSNNLFNYCLGIKNSTQHIPLVKKNPLSSKPKGKKSYNSQILTKHNRCLKVFTYPSNEKDIQVYTNLFFLNPPYLQNLPAITSLKYSYKTNLITDNLHYIQVSPSETIIFFQDKSLLFTGLIISGYTYKIIHSFTKSSLNKIGLLDKNLHKIQKYLDLKPIQDTHHASTNHNSYSYG